MSSPRSEEVPQRLVALLDQLIEYQREFLQTIEGLRAMLLAGLAGTASPEQIEETLLQVRERFHEFLRTRGLEEPDEGPRA